MYESLGNIEFSLDADGKGQYRAIGASDWIPFLSDSVKHGSCTLGAGGRFEIDWEKDSFTRLMLITQTDYYSGLALKYVSYNVTPTKVGYTIDTGWYDKTSACTITISDGKFVFDPVNGDIGYKNADYMIF